MTLFARAVTNLYVSQMNPFNTLTPYYSTIPPFYQVFRYLRGVSVTILRIYGVRPEFYSDIINAKHSEM